MDFEENRVRARNNFSAVIEKYSKPVKGDVVNLEKLSFVKDRGYSRDRPTREFGCAPMQTEVEAGLAVGDSFLKTPPMASVTLTSSEKRENEKLKAEEQEIYSSRMFSRMMLGRLRAVGAKLIRCRGEMTVAFPGSSDLEKSDTEVLHWGQLFPEYPTTDHYSDDDNDAELEDIEEEEEGEEEEENTDDTDVGNKHHNGDKSAEILEDNHQAGDVTRSAVDLPVTSTSQSNHNVLAEDIESIKHIDPTICSAAGPPTSMSSDSACAQLELCSKSQPSTLLSESNCLERVGNGVSLPTPCKTIAKSKSFYLTPTVTSSIALKGVVPVVFFF